MKKELSVVDYFYGLEEIFNPVPVYEGNYPIDVRVFSLVSKTKNGKNLFDEYLSKKYERPIDECLKNLNGIGNNRLYFLSDTDKVHGRTLKLCGSLFFIQFCHKFIGDCIDLPDDNSKLRGALTTYFRKYRADITRLLNGEIDEVTTNIDNNLRPRYEMGEEIKKQKMGRLYVPLSYKRYLELIKEKIGYFLLSLRYLIPLFEKEVNLGEVEECLDMDKFYLAMMKQLIEISKDTLKHHGSVNSSFIHVEKYIRVVKELRKNGKYNLKVNTYLFDGNMVIVSVDDIIREYNEIKVAYPEFQVYTVDNDGKDYRSFENANELTEQLQEFIESKKLEASWEFIRKGTIEKEIPIEPIVDRLNKNPKKKKTKEEKEQLVVDRMTFLDSTNYLYKMTGKNNFTGYVGYIYDNDVVVFEKYYKDFDSRIPVESSATYIMNFNNFVQMSMLTKVEIMDYIKQGGNDVRRVYHTSGWCNRMMQIINGNTYDAKTMEKIDRLINEGQLTKGKK